MACHDACLYVTLISPDKLVGIWRAPPPGGWQSPAPDQGLKKILFFSSARLVVVS